MILRASKLQKQLKKLSRQDQTRVVETLQGFLQALKEGPIPQGYGFKKLNGDKYEIRAGIRLRIVMKLEADTLICHVAGNHEEVRRYLRTFQNK